jgi:hypothetical protein
MKLQKNDGLKSAKLKDNDQNGGAKVIVQHRISIWCATPQFLPILWVNNNKMSKAIWVVEWAHLGEGEGKKENEPKGDCLSCAERDVGRADLKQL